MKIVIRENEVATIHDQLDEQMVRLIPVKAKQIDIVFYSSVEESAWYLEAKKEALLFSLQDWGILDNIEDIEVNYDTIIDTGSDYRAELEIIV